LGQELAGLDREAGFGEDGGDNSIALGGNVDLVLDDERAGGYEERIVRGRNRSGRRVRDGTGRSRGGPRVGAAELQEHQCERQENRCRVFVIHHDVNLTIRTMTTAWNKTTKMRREKAHSQRDAIRPRFYPGLAFPDAGDRRDWER